MQDLSYSSLHTSWLVVLSARLNPCKTRSIWHELNWRCRGKLRLEGSGQWRALLCSSGCIYIKDASWRQKQLQESMNNELIDRLETVYLIISRSDTWALTLVHRPPHCPSLHFTVTTAPFFLRNRTVDSSFRKIYHEWWNHQQSGKEQQFWHHVLCLWRRQLKSACIPASIGN